MPNAKPKVEIKFLSTFFSLTRKEIISVSVPEGAELNTVLDLIETRLGSELASYIRDYSDYVVVAVNNVDCKQLQGLKTKIKNGDKIVIGHVIAGG
jgi:molybdopterin converting factor small subunit